MTNRYNVTLIGEACTGKTTIANQLLHKAFSGNYKATIGATMLRVQYDYEGATNMFYIWDTAGMEKYRSLCPVYYRDSTAAILVYDISDRTTFEKLDFWHKLYFDTVGKEKPVIVVGNKSDLAENEGGRAVKEEDGKVWAIAHDCEFLEVSAKNGMNLENILKILSSRLKNYELDDDMISVSNRYRREKKKCC